MEVENNIQSSSNLKKTILSTATSLVIIVISYFVIFFTNFTGSRSNEDWGGGSGLLVLFWLAVTTIIVIIINSAILFKILQKGKLFYIFISSLIILATPIFIVKLSMMYNASKIQKDINEQYPTCLEFVKQANRSADYTGEAKLPISYCDQYKK